MRGNDVMLPMESSSAVAHALERILPLELVPPFPLDPVAGLTVLGAGHAAVAAENPGKVAGRILEREPLALFSRARFLGIRRTRGQLRAPAGAQADLDFRK